MKIVGCDLHTRYQQIGGWPSLSSSCHSPYNLGAPSSSPSFGDRVGPDGTGGPPKLRLLGWGFSSQTALPSLL